MIKQISILGLLAALAAPLAGPAFAQDTMQKPDSMSHDAMKPNAMSSGAMKHDSMKPSDHMSPNGMKKQSMPRTASTPDAMGSDKMAPK